MWLRHKEFKEEVRRAWAGDSGEISLSVKLKRCMQRFHQWGMSTFGRVGRKGDRNTAYFHEKASQRRRRNRIDHIKDPARVLWETESQIAPIITNYFQDIFVSQVDACGEDWSKEFKMIPKVVTDDMNNALNAPFTEGEVKRALFQMHPSKAPGLDGFSAMFYQRNWEIVGQEVVREVLNCLNNGLMNTELNETLIVLVPKVKKVEMVEDLRPISLCNVAMKLITKVLANRLKWVLPEIISQSQSAFIGGRLITDNILIAHELSHSMKCRNKQKTGSMSLKLDMSKAYDRIEWSFLKQMMLSMGFCEGWVRRVMLCVETISYRITINDEISDSITPSRGLRQGDPISPYLFLICADWLTYAIKDYQELGLLQGLRVCKRAPPITHLMFAEYCMLFIEARPNLVTWIRDVLKRYEAVSGQKVNYSKSKAVCSSNVAGSFKQMVVDSLQTKTVGSHSLYLGLPILFGNKKIPLLRSIEEKVLRKTSDWKNKLLSGAGKEILIKSVLQAIPLYAMSCFKIPDTLCKKLTSDILKFWWRSSKDRGIHWLKAKELYKEKEVGGLGFRELEKMNMALLAKQARRIVSKPDLLVSRVFKAKYFPNSDLFNATGGARPSYAWRGIAAARDVLKSGTEWDEEDGRYRWMLDGSGDLTVKSAYYAARELDRQRNGGEEGPSDMGEVRRFWKSYWKLKIPSKDLDLPLAVWENQCDDTGYWLWLCAKLCSGEEFKALLCGLWMGWRDRNEKSGESFDEPVILCDGSFDQQAKEAGAGVVVCLEGKVEVARAEWANNISSVLEAECRAIKLGLKVAEELQFNRVTLLSDSSEVIWALNMGVWRSGGCGAELKECIKLLEEHPCWSIGSINRESNAAADWLAKRARVEKWEWRDKHAIPFAPPFRFCYS
ncbi:hypothetical protein QQ045_008034 [Rhodiola kirilowii]